MKSKVELLINGKIELSETIETTDRIFAQKLFIAALRIGLLSALVSIEKAAVAEEEEKE